MKLTVLYRPKSEHGTQIEGFLREFQHRQPQTTVELLDIDTRDGSALASLYDIMQYPAIMVLQDNGTVQQLWQGSQLPLIDEVASYARS